MEISDQLVPFSRPDKIIRVKSESSGRVFSGFSFEELVINEAEKDLSDFNRIDVRFCDKPGTGEAGVITERDDFHAELKAGSTGHNRGH